MRARAWIVAALMAALGACQDTGSGPELWTVTELHEDVGLTGGHQQSACADCHAGTGTRFQGLDIACEACHLAEHAEVLDPDHALLGYSTICAQCHLSEAWRPAASHHDTAAFALEGAHARLRCGTCHEGGIYEALPGDCWSCHEGDLAGVEPDHVALDFDRDCTACHSVEAWTPSRFDHDATDFPLAGAHVEVTCADCHTAGVQEALAGDCWSCHQGAFEEAEPDHVALDLDRDCTVCHTVDAWSPALFDHGQTDFLLDGAHVEADCQSCHVEGFADTPTDCAVCHAEDEPADHFGPACAECHTTTAWTPATFDHETRFPLQRGDHRRYGDSCGSCHLERPSYATFTCTDCHDNEHERRDMDDEHDDVRDYRYESAACYDCHPTGSEEDGEGDDD